jgi:hypothetical protein
MGTCRWCGNPTQGNAKFCSEYEEELYNKEHNPEYLEDKIRDAIDLLIEGGDIEDDKYVNCIRRKIESLSKEDKEKLRYMSGTIRYWAKLLKSE